MKSGATDTSGEWNRRTVEKGHQLVVTLEGDCLVSLKSSGDKIKHRKSKYSQVTVC